MIIGNTDTDKEVFVIAEIGNNHEGNFNLAQELIGLAKEAGAHAVKFQTFKTEQFLSKKEEARFKRTKSFELTQDQFTNLSKYAKEQGIIFFSTPLDLDSAAFLNSIQPIYKISSGDNNFYPMIEVIAKTGKPIIMSGGMADLAQFQYTKSFIEMVWQENSIKQEMALLHCVTSYPVSPEEANLQAITHFKKIFNCTIGYSDHTLGIEACVLAVALGARVIEKHFTINKNHSDFRDHKLSADPQDLKDMMNRIKHAEILLGNADRKVQQTEINIMQSMRRSIVAKHELQKGHLVKWSDLAWARPATGLPPGAEHKVLGRTLKQAVATGDNITVDILD